MKAFLAKPIDATAIEKLITAEVGNEPGFGIAFAVLELSRAHLAAYQALAESIDRLAEAVDNIGDK